MVRGETGPMKVATEVKIIIGAVVSILAAISSIWFAGFRTHAALQDYEGLPARVAAAEIDRRDLRTDLIQKGATLDSIKDQIWQTSCLQNGQFWGEPRDTIIRRCGLSRTDFRRGR